MTLPSLPAQGSGAWYPWAQAEDAVIRDVSNGRIVKPRRRWLPNQTFAGRALSSAPTVMATPPTITYNAASQITSNVITRFTPPAPGKAQGGAGLCLGGSLFAYFSNRNQGTGWTVLAAGATAGSTTLSLTNNIGAGSYVLQPSSGTITGTSGYTQTWLESAETVTITGITGSGPYTATLSAPTTYDHLAADQVITTAVPAPGFNTGSSIVPVKFPGCTPLVSYEVITDAPTVEWYTYFPSGLTYRMWVDGQVVAASATALGVGSAGQPSNNMSGFITAAFGSRQLRRIRLEVDPGIGVIGVSTGPTDSVACPAEPNVRVLMVSDSYIGGFDGIQSRVARLMGWDNMIVDQVGGSGYEADNTANVGTPARMGNRLPIIAAARADIVVVALGLNDDPTSSTLQAAVTTDLSSIQGMITAPMIYAIGPWATTNSTNTTKGPVATKISAACAATGVTYIDTILGAGPGMNPWVKGTGFTGTLTGVGNSDVMLNSDATHPTPAYGIPYNAVRIAEGIAQAIPA